MNRALLAVLFLPCIVMGCGDKPAQSPTEVSSPALFMRRGSLEDRFLLSGELEAENAELLRVPRTQSFMVSIQWMAEEGTLVKKGDKVVEFDTSSLSGSLADKNLAVQRAEADLVSDSARNDATWADKQMEVERRRTALAKAKLEAAVPAELRTRREHQEKQLAVAKETDALEKAHGELAAQERTLRLDRRVKEIALARTKRELADVETSLETLTLRAGRDGLFQVAINFRDGGRKYQTGDAIRMGEAVASLPDLAVLQIRARLYDVDEGAVKSGMTARCVLDAYPDRAVEGVVTQVSPMARPEGRDAVRRIFEVVVKLQKTEPFMLPGMSARVEVLQRKVDNALLMPREALRMVGNKTAVRLRSGQDTPVDVEFCAPDACALRGGPPEGTALSPALFIARSSS